MSTPLWRQLPQKYAYNTKTKKHVLKSGRAYREQFRDDPSAFVASSTMIEHDDILPVRPVAEPVVIAQPTPVEQPQDTLAARVREAIKDEVKTNTPAYAGKSDSELERLFRTMLIERLTKPKVASPKAINDKPKPTTKPKNKPVFKLREPIIEDSEETEDEYENIDD